MNCLVMTASMFHPSICSYVYDFMHTYHSLPLTNNPPWSLHPQSSSDLPLLVQVRDLATRLLTDLTRDRDRDSSDTPISPISPGTPSFIPSTPADASNDFRIGFITPPWKDNKIPVTDHLHAHAYVLPADKLGWWRGVAYGGLAWYAIEDLIAEIRYARTRSHEFRATRTKPTTPSGFPSALHFACLFVSPISLNSEETSNNRVKSGYINRSNAPINKVAHAGSRTGHADGTETTEPSLGISDIEDGSNSRPPSRSLVPVSPSSSASRPSTSRSVSAATSSPVASSSRLEPAVNVPSIRV